MRERSIGLLRMPLTKRSQHVWYFSQLELFKSRMTESTAYKSMELMRHDFYDLRYLNCRRFDSTLFYVYKANKREDVAQYGPITAGISANERGTKMAHTVHGMSVHINLPLRVINDTSSVQTVNCTIYQTSICHYLSKDIWIAHIVGFHRER